MRVALAPISPIVGDLEGNAALIVDAIRKAEALHAELVVFPELALLGYPPRDLLDRPAVVDRAVDVLETVVAETRDTAALLGTVMPNPQPTGQRTYNTAVLARHGRIVARYHKQLLPSYDVFDESRYFEPGRTTVVCTPRKTCLGISICEDIWNLEGNWNDVRYAVDPIATQVATGAELLVNLSASPFHEGKLQRKERLLVETAKRYRRPLIYVNQLGGKDSLIFDGTSWAIDGEGRIMLRTEPFREQLCVVDLEAPGDVREPLPPPHVGELYEALLLGLRDYVDTCGFERVVLGLSGGIDSALVAALASAALGPERVVGVSMPSRYSSEGSRNDAAALAHNLGIRYESIAIESMFGAFLDTLAPHFAGREPDIAEENLQSRIRGTILMALSNKFGWLVLATGNKSELATGYCTLYGDMCGGLSPIGDLPKLLVYEMARYVNRKREIIPESTLAKPPSAELRPDQKDTDSLPPYEELDPILRAYVEDHKSPGAIVAEGHDPRTVERLVRLVNRSEYKRQQAALPLKVTAKAFGFGRRLPIAARFPDEAPRQR